MSNIINFYHAAIRIYDLVPRRHQHIKQAVLHYYNKGTYKSRNELIKTCSPLPWRRHIRMPPFQGKPRKGRRKLVLPD